MNRTIRVLTLPYPAKEATMQRRAVGTRDDELVMFNVGAVIEVFALVSLQRIETDRLVLIHSFNLMADEFAKLIQKRIGHMCVVKTLSEFEGKNFTEHFMPKTIRVALRNNPNQFEVMFGPFSKLRDALIWHDSEFVEAVGRGIGEAFAEISDDRTVIGLSIAHSASKFMYYRLSVPIEIKCSQQFGCSVSSHERDLAKAIARGILSC